MDKELKYLTKIITHRAKVQETLETVASKLKQRAFSHDLSKFNASEFDGMSNKLDQLEETEFGSSEYYKILKSLKNELGEHYFKNRHHPEHYIDKIESMSLIDLLEMIADWKAASKSVRFSDTLDTCFERFNVPKIMKHQIAFTCLDLGWIDPEEYIDMDLD